MHSASTPQEAAEAAETLVVYSLDPVARWSGAPVEPGAVWVEDCLVYGSATVTDPQVRRDILNAVRKGIEEAEQNPEKFKRCMFRPRHRVRHQGVDGTETDWMICFSCQEITITENGQPREWVKAGETKTRVWNTTRRAQKLLNDTLRDAGVKLADGADEGE